MVKVKNFYKGTSPHLLKKYVCNKCNFDNKISPINSTHLEMQLPKTHNFVQMLKYCHHSRVLREFFRRPGREKDETFFKKTFKKSKNISLKTETKHV